MDDNGYAGEATPVCPIPFINSDIRYAVVGYKQQVDVDTQLENIRNAIGISTAGWTLKGYYEGAVERAEFIRKQGLESLDTEERR